jgi:hypothetical protein
MIYNDDPYGRTQAGLSRERDAQRERDKLTREHAIAKIPAIIDRLRELAEAIQDLRDRVERLENKGGNE